MPTQPTYRAHAIAAGIFFVIATGFLFLGESFYGPGLTPPNVLEKAAAARGQIVTGLLIEFFCVLAIPFIAIVLYPVLRRVSPVIAIGYLAFRLFEAIMLATIEVQRMLILAMSEAHLASPDLDTGSLELMITAINAGDPWTSTTGLFYNIVFLTGMVMLNWALWTSRLLPRVISGWGLLSTLPLLSVSIIGQYVHIDPGIAIPMILPLAVQEMALALWLIIKGFRPEALARLPA
ncbi:MAG: DUF4386 domain-containing protein [Maritimibacter sp.]